MSKSHNSQPSTKNTLKLRAAGLVLATTAVLAACTPNSKTTAAPTPEATVAATPTPTKSAAEIAADAARAAELQNSNREAADEVYLKSPERNARIASALQADGARILKLANSGKNGRFSFYNWDNDRWGRKNNEGWGGFQHNPQYGGPQNQIEVDVYQDAKGKIDPSKGIASIYVSPISTQKPGLQIISPLEIQLSTHDATAGDSYTTEVDTMTSAGGSVDDVHSDNAGFVDNYTVDQLKALDDQVLNGIDAYLTDLGV